MKKIATKIHKETRRKRLWQFLFIFILSLGIASGTLPGSSPAAAQDADQEKIALKGKKFQIEFYGGYSALNPSDLNMRLDYDRQIQHFFYDDYYNFLINNNQISYWRKEINGERLKIKKTFPFGIRFKYYLSNSIALSVGFKYLSRKQTSDFTYQYRRLENFGQQFIDKKEYSPYALSVKGYTPMLGIHFIKKIAGYFGIEGYITGGPLFAECMYVAGWDSQWLYQGNNYTYLMYQSYGRLEEKGKGTGYTLDLGGRINIVLAHRLGLFIELGYGFQVANRISGPGLEVRDESSETWEGQWGIKEENIQTAWGSMVLQSPTNYREGWPEGQQIRDFKLDLSGFQLRMGISLRF